MLALKLESESLSVSDGEPGDSSQAGGTPAMAPETSAGPRPSLSSFLSAQLTASLSFPAQSSYSAITQESSTGGGMDGTATQKSMKSSNEFIPSLFTPLSSYKFTLSTSPAETTRQTTCPEGSMAPTTFYSPQSLSLSGSSNSLPTLQHLPPPPSCGLEGGESTPEQQPKSLTTLAALSHLQNIGEQRRPARMTSSTKPCTGTSSEPCRCFDAPLPTLTPQATAVLPRPYRPRLNTLPVASMPPLPRERTTQAVDTISQSLSSHP